MIIDVHTHLAFSKLYPSEYLLGMMQGAEGKIDTVNLSKFINVLLKDRSGEWQVKQMDEASIEKSVLLIMDAGLHLSEPKFDIEEIHRIHYEILQKHPDRFIVFGSADPRRGQKGFDLFCKSVNEYKFKGIKLYPPFGYGVTDSRLGDYYQICNENKLTVLIHTDAVDDDDFSNPLSVEKIAEKYPDINFILAHAFFNLSPRLIKILKSYNNIYFDISGYSTTLNAKGSFLKECFSKIFEYNLESNVLFGSDWPLFNLMVPLKVHIDKLLAFGNQNFNENFDHLLNTQMHNNTVKALRL